MPFVAQSVVFLGNLPTILSQSTPVACPVQLEVADNSKVIILTYWADVHLDFERKIGMNQYHVQCYPINIFNE